MITIDKVSEQPKPRGARAGTLTKKAAAALRQKIEWALREHGNRLGPSATRFLHSIFEELSPPVIRLSKRQLDVTEEIVLQAAFGEPVVIMEGDALADLLRLFRHATGDSRLSSFEECIMVELKYRACEPVIAVTQGVWRVVETIRQKTLFDLLGELAPLDIDGLVENDDPDGLPPGRSEIEADRAREWAFVGVIEDDYV